MTGARAAAIVAALESGGAKMGDPGGRYAAFTKQLLDSVLSPAGRTPAELRRAAMTRAARRASTLPRPLSGPHPLSPSPFGRGGTTHEASFSLSGTERGTGGEDSRTEPGSGGDDVPPALAGYVDKVALHAHKVTDEDLAALQRAGNSDDVLFELTVSAALGAGLGRLERGLAALRGEPD